MAMITEEALRAVLAASTKFQRLCERHKVKSSEPLELLDLEDEQWGALINWATGRQDATPRVLTDWFESRNQPHKGMTVEKALSCADEQFINPNRYDDKRALQVLAEEVRRLRETADETGFENQRKFDAIGLFGGALQEVRAVLNSAKRESMSGEQWRADIQAVFDRRVLGDDFEMLGKIAKHGSPLSDANKDADDALRRIDARRVAGRTESSERRPIEVRHWNVLHSSDVELVQQRDEARHQLGVCWGALADVRSLLSPPDAPQTAEQWREAVRSVFDRTWFRGYGATSAPEFVVFDEQGRVTEIITHKQLVEQRDTVSQLHACKVALKELSEVLTPAQHDSAVVRAVLFRYWGAVSNPDKGSV